MVCANGGQRCDFNPRSPHGERQHWHPSAAAPGAFQPTLPARGATRRGMVRSRGRAISTHATRTGSDASRLFCSTLRCNISTHAPRTGSDAITRSASFSCIPFQPTLPARGATDANWLARLVKESFQPTLPARGATGLFCPCKVWGKISTHAPRTGSDLVGQRFGRLTVLISTHAPRTGSDGFGWLPSSAHQAISTHAPRTGSD